MTADDAAVDAKIMAAKLVHDLARRFDMGLHLAAQLERDDEADAAVFEDRRRRTVRCLMRIANRGEGA